jgi:hypothetical protein
MQNFKPIMKTLAANLKTGVIVLLALMMSVSALPAQTPNGLSAFVPPKGYVIQITDGELFLGGLEERIDVKALFPGAASKVTATLGNFVKVMRALDTNAEIVLDPAMEEDPVHDLRWSIPKGISDMFKTQELAGASGYKYDFGYLPHSKLYIFFSRYYQVSDRSFEVFNLSGYFTHLTIQESHLLDEKDKSAKVQEIEEIINSTLKELQGDAKNSAYFAFHPGTSLLVVIGPASTISVAHKIINALPSTDPTTGLPMPVTK